MDSPSLPPLNLERSLDVLFCGLAVCDSRLPTSQRIDGIAMDSRELRANELFFACAGKRRHGLHFLDEVRRKEGAIIVHDALTPLPPDTPFIRVHHLPRSLQTVAARHFRHPERDLILLGVIGSTGRTAISTIAHYFIEGGRTRAGLLNQEVHYTCYRPPLPPRLVTPPALHLYRAFAEMRSARARHAVLELTTEGLAQGRVRDLGFHILLFHDHCPPLRGGFSSEEAMEIKFAPFLRQDHLRPDIAVINRDSPSACRLLELIPRDDNYVSITYGLTDHAEVRILQLSERRDGHKGLLQWPGGKAEIFLPFHQIEAIQEVLAALAMAYALHRDLSECPPLVENIRNILQFPRSSRGFQLEFNFGA
jgi:UDP-N-acetylmuramyl tripeptide synthase